jgi:hypothetical protein
MKPSNINDQPQRTADFQSAPSEAPRPVTPDALNYYPLSTDPPPARPMVPHRSGGLSLTDGALVFR